MIQSTCVYLIDGNTWLFLLRNKKENDANEGKYIGVGGKKISTETSEECARRETFEETGLIIDALKYEGSIIFQISQQEEEISEIYTCREFHGTLHESDEGTLVHVDQSEIFSLNLWDGDRIFLKRILDHQTPFSFIFRYNTSNELMEWTEKSL